MAKKGGVPKLVHQLRAAILGSGRSLGEISRASGVGTDRISRFVRGERTLTLPAAGRICEVLHLSLVADAPRKKPRRKAPPT